MSHKYRAEQQRARARLHMWRRGQRFRARMSLLLSVFAIVAGLMFTVVLAGMLS